MLAERAARRCGAREPALEITDLHGNAEAEALGKVETRTYVFALHPAFPHP